MAPGDPGRDLDPSVEGAARICLGHALLAGGRARDGLRELEQACQSPLLTGAERAEAKAWASFDRMLLADLDGAATAAEEARSAAVSAGDPAVLIAGLFLIAGLAAAFGTAGPILANVMSAVEAVWIPSAAISFAQTTHS